MRDGEVNIDLIVNSDSACFKNQGRNICDEYWKN